MSRELLEESVKSLMEICNKIYTKIERSPRKVISEEDFELVKTFNQLLKINQRNLDVLYPDREISYSEPRCLSFKSGLNSGEIVEEVSDDKK